MGRYAVILQIEDGNGDGPNGMFVQGCKAVFEIVDKNGGHGMLVQGCRGISIGSGGPRISEEVGEICVPKLHLNGRIWALD